MFLKSWSVKVHINDRIILTSYLQGPNGLNFTTTASYNIRQGPGCYHYLTHTYPSLHSILDCHWFLTKYSLHIDRLQITRANT